jgi:hypothetical protein
MFVNDTGVVYRPKKAKDFVFCMDCATSMTMSIAQDISKLDPDLGLSYYFKFKTQEASVINLRRHANALKELASKMENHADSIAYFHHPDEDK